MLSNICNWLYYLTKAFGADAFSIRWCARVQGHGLVTRRDLLPDEPDHPRADQRYYRLQLGKLVELPHPIPSRSLRRIPFVLTMGAVYRVDFVVYSWRPIPVRAKGWRRCWAADPTATANYSMRGGVNG